MTEGPVVAAPRELQLGDGDRGEPAQVADREVDLAEQEDEDNAIREHAVPAVWMMMLLKLFAVKKTGALTLKKMTMSDEPDDDRQDAEVTRAQVVPARTAEALRAAASSCTSG